MVCCTEQGAGAGPVAGERPAGVLVIEGAEGQEDLLLNLSPEADGLFGAGAGVWQAPSSSCADNIWQVLQRQASHARFPVSFVIRLPCEACTSCARGGTCLSGGKTILLGVLHEQHLGGHMRWMGPWVLCLL